MRAAGIPGAVRECLIIPAHGSCTNTKEVPGHPGSLLLYKDKKSAKSSQITALAVQARTQCQLVLRSPGGLIWGAMPPHKLKR